MYVGADGLVGFLYPAPCILKNVPLDAHIHFCFDLHPQSSSHSPATDSMTCPIVSGSPSVAAALPQDTERPGALEVHLHTDGGEVVELWSKLATGTYAHGRRVIP